MNTNLSDATVFFVSNVWPEPDSSAAGRHMMQLVDLLYEKGASIHFGCTSAQQTWADETLADRVRKHIIRMNDDAFDELIKSINPDIVIFDRFMAEEQFSWRVKTCCPDALRILNTEDLHFLRRYRETLKDTHFGRVVNDIQAFHSQDARRELASIYRSDLSLIISSAEIDLLVTSGGIQQNLLHYYPLFAEKHDPLPSGFDDRLHFMSVGNFHHKPNQDAFMMLQDQIWPEIHRRLPDAELHIYGAYCSDQFMSMSNPQAGFLVKGRAENLTELMLQYRILLAPLRFGAGLKGKLLDAMRHGMACVTTEIGSEGISQADDFPGAVAESGKAFIRASTELYQSKTRFSESVSKGYRLIESNFDPGSHNNALAERLANLLATLDAHRARNVTGGMLWHHSLRSTEYMGRWISLKESKRS